MSDGITLITPTSDRPEAFRLCERWLKRAIDNFGRGPVQWIVADDGRQPVDCTLGQLHLRRPPSPDAGISFRGNLLAALRRARHDKILFIEDDDWYAPNYLERMSRWLDFPVSIVGEANAKYYNICSRRYRLCLNRSHSSLCQTGIRAPLAHWLIRRIERHAGMFLDLDLWKVGAANLTKLLWPNTIHCVGMKGLPGKRGLGIGHRLGWGCCCDPDGKVLHRWIGRDADLYLELGAACPPKNTGKFRCRGAPTSTVATQPMLTSVKLKPLEPSAGARGSANSESRAK